MGIPKWVPSAVIWTLLVLIVWGLWRENKLTKERIRWEEATDSLIVTGAIKDSLASLISARADSLEAVAQRVVVLRPENDSTLGRMAVEAWHLRAALDTAQAAADSLALYPGIVAQADTLLQATKVTLRAERAANSNLYQANGLLHQRITLDSGRIVDLTHQLTTVPKPAGKRLLLGFLPFRAAPCVFGGVTTNGEGRIGAGACLTK